MAKAKRRARPGRPRGKKRNAKAKVTKSKKPAPKRGRQQLLVTPLPDPARQDAVKLGTLTYSVKVPFTVCQNFQQYMTAYTC